MPVARGLAAGAATFIAAVLLLTLVAIGALGIGEDASTDGLGAVFAVITAIAAGCAASIGAWQAAAGGARTQRAALGIGIAAPLLVAVPLVAANPGSAGDAALALAATAAGAVAGATALARRLR